MRRRNYIDGGESLQDEVTSTDAQERRRDNTGRVSFVNNMRIYRMLAKV
jgi:hypothetical protein